MKITEKKYLLFYILVLISFRCYSQQYRYDFGFQRESGVQVKDESTVVLKYPWAGGMNSCQFSAIDLNFDGIKDVFVFDKTGNRILTFLNKGTPNSPDYTFTPEYISSFPLMHDWVMIKDYNNDGKEDVFTNGIAGIAVYRNVSDSELKFEFITNTLNAQQGSIYSNIPVTSVDYPAIDDIDGDGDLDILAFFTLGSYVYYYQNQSMEKYKKPDSLDFKLKVKCWGDFAESSSSNKIKLNIECPWKCNDKSGESKSEKAIEHTGSTMLTLDANGDNVKDIIIGDVDYSNLILLYNGGKSDSAHIVSQDTAFPSNSKPLQLTSFPVPTYLDVDNDNLNDIIVSPFEGRPDISEGFKSVWLYKNTGTKQKPVFTFQTDNFLQGDMIDVGAGAFPVLFDYDNDGLKDLLVSNYGYRDSSYFTGGFLISVFRSKLALFRNTGTKSQPSFSLVTRDFAKISSLKLLGTYPAFADLDDDGDSDMLLGNADGTLLYYENTAPQNQPADFVFKQTKFQNISVGNYSAPQFIDIDNDSKKDLVIGCRNGTISYYRNTGSPAAPVFTIITKNFGKVNVTDTNISYTGYSVPYFFRDKSGDLKLFVGSEQGKVYYYKDIENNLNGRFTYAGELTFKGNDKVHILNEGYRVGVAVDDLNNDNYPDMLVGNFAGGLSYFKGITPPVIDNIPDNNYQIIKSSNFQIYPNPSDTYITIKTKDIPANSDMQILITDIFGRIIYTNSWRSFVTSANNIQININNFTDGIYFCTLSFSSSGKYSTLTKKFIVNH